MRCEECARSRDEVLNLLCDCGKGGATNEVCSRRQTKSIVRSVESATKVLRLSAEECGV